MLEIISNKTDKSKSISLLINDLRITKKNVYTIGDSYTDINMIKDFNGYAMSNSNNSLKKYAIKEYESVSELVKELIKK